jgi:hypothetical protein
MLSINLFFLILFIIIWKKFLFDYFVYILVIFFSFIFYSVMLIFVIILIFSYYIKTGWFLIYRNELPPILSSEKVSCFTRSYLDIKPSQP